MATDAAPSLQLHLERPSSARIYAYMLDPHTKNAYAIDRDFGDRQLTKLPDMRKAMRENRRFIGRAVETALEAGIRQFVDVGSGLPSEGQVHEVADTVAPGEARVVYVDNELIAHAHSEVLLSNDADTDRHRAVLADFFNHGDLLRRVQGTGLIDFAQPVCLLVTAILHFMPPADRPDVPMTVYRDRLAPRSMLVITHVADDPDDEGLQAVARNYSQTASPASLRRDEDLLPFFGGWPLLEPGVTWSGLWRPKANRSVEPWWDEDSKAAGHTNAEPWWDDRPSRMLYRAAVAVKP